MYYYNDTRIDNVSPEMNSVVDGYLVRTVDDGKQMALDEIRKRIATKGQTQWKLLDTLQLINIRTFLSERGIHPRQVIERLRGLHGVDTDRYVATRITEGGAYTEDSIRRAADSIMRMAKVAGNCGANFTMVILPSYAEAYYGTVEPSTERLLDHLADSDVEVLDLRSFTHEKVFSLILGYNAHYSEVGTGFVASVIGGFLMGKYPEARGAQSE